MSEAYKWTDKMPKVPTRASGLDNASSSDSKRQLDRIRAENGELNKTVFELKETVRDLMDTVKALTEKKPASKKGAKSGDDSKPEDGAEI